ncbi:MAG: PFL_4669 family integrating conjugative element protein [Saezia sp.]
MTETDSFKLNIGVLRSSMTLQIHTRHASRLWFGRRAHGNRHGILGLNAFLSITNRINIGSRMDDPYSDYWMILVEEKIDQVSRVLKALKEEVNKHFEQVPSSLTISDNLNIAPANLPVFAGSHMGYMAIFILAQYDEIVRKAMLAKHIALLDYLNMDQFLTRGDHALRGLFALVAHYRVVDVQRKDFAEDNDKARAALQKFGEVPADIMDGTRRSRFSPPLRTGTESVVEDFTNTDDTQATLTVVVAAESSLEEDEEDDDEERRATGNEV